jgi:predicted homoserine dehydrogenase-like protein
LIGEKVTKLEDGAFALAKEAGKLNKVLSDYIISPEAPPGVFIVATHHESLAAGLQTYKMGKGPYYLHYKPIHLCYFEIPKTILRAYNTRNVLLDNGNQPKVSVGAITKTNISAHTEIEKGIGSREMRGEAINIADHPNHVPIGLFDKVVIKRNLEPGQVITFDDVDIPESNALKGWIHTLETFKKSNILVTV